MFNIDNKFFTFLSKVTDLLVLNFIFIICSLPLITIGASTTALYGVTKKMAANSEGYIIKTFLKEFKENFLKSTAIWFLMILILGVVLADYLIVNLMFTGTMLTVLKGILIGTMILVIGVLMYGLTLLCTFENTIKNTLKNAVLMMIGHFPWSLIIIFFTISPVLAILYLSKHLGIILVLMLTIWFASTALINSYIFNRIYKKYM